MNISIASEQDRNAWDVFVINCPNSTIYHLIRWKDIIEQSYGRSAYYLIAEENNAIVGVLPLVFISNYLMGNSLTSLPFVNYGGICTNNLIAQKKLLEEAIVLAKKLRVKYIEFRQLQELSELSLPAKKEKVTLLLELPSSEDILWKQLDPKVRNQVRKAMRSGLTFQLGGKELLHDFYRVFSQNMHDLGSPAHSRIFFEQIFFAFPESTKIAGIFSGPHMISSAILFTFKEHIEVPWASSMREYLHYCPNNLLYWELLKFGCEQKFRYFDFGRSTVNSGTYKFKSQWGAKSNQLYWYYYLNGMQHVPLSFGQSKKMQFISYIWKRTPVKITQKIGPMIRKYISA